MNNAPEQTQELSTKQTQLEDIVKQLSQRVHSYETMIQNGTAHLIHQMSTISDPLWEEFLTYLTEKRSQILKGQVPQINVTQAITSLSRKQANGEAHS